MTLLRLIDIGKRTGGGWVLRNVNLELNAGEILSVLGTSGSGKSLLAKLICGLEEQTQGSILIGDDDAQDVSLGMALDVPPNAPELTVYENLSMFAGLMGVPRKSRAREVSFFLELLDLSDLRSVRAANLSAGALRRMELARALLTDADVLLIDSLLDTLNSVLFERIWQYLLDLKQQSKSVIVFTSSGRVAEQCARVAVLHRGKIAFSGRPDDLRRMAGEDMVVLADTNNPLIRSRICEHYSLVIREEDGFLTFRSGNSERAVLDLLSEFGSEVSCIYVKRPSLDDAIAALDGGSLLQIPKVEMGVE